MDTHPNPALRVEMPVGADIDEEDDEGGKEGQVLGNGTGVNHARQTSLDRTTAKSMSVQMFYKPAYELEDEAAERLGRDW